MFSRIIIYDEDHESGAKGFRVRGMGFTEPGGAMTLAHDLLEHFPNDKGTLEEELIAHGAMLHIRHPYYWGGNTKTAEAIGGGFEFIDSYFRDTGASFRPCGKTKPLSDDLEYELESIYLAGLTSFDNNDQEVASWMNDQEAVMGWLRKGYRKAVRRYAAMHAIGGTPVEFFWELERNINRILSRHLVTGDQFKVILNFKRFSINIEEFYERE